MPEAGVPQTTEGFDPAGAPYPSARIVWTKRNRPIKEAIDQLVYIIAMNITREHTESSYNQIHTQRKRALHWLECRLNHDENPDSQCPQIS